MRPYTLSNKVFASFARSARTGRSELARFGSSETLTSSSLPYEKFLALGRGSLPADLVYELQFSFNFQLPVVKDQKMVLDTIGGGSRIRTGDILLAKQTLYQLSYTPLGFCPPTQLSRLRRTPSVAGLPSVVASS